MVELGKGGKHVGVARLPHTDTEIHIVEGHGIALVQAVHLIIDLPADEQAGGGIAVNILHIVQPPHVAIGCRREILVQVARHAADAKADAGMLNGVIGVEQLCTHTAHPLLLGVHDHFLQPVGGDDLGIVVEQQQVFAGGILLAKVVQGAVIEALALPGHDLEVVRVFLLHPLVGAEGLGLLAVVFDEDELKIRVGGAGIDGIHAELQIPDVVAGRDEDAHPARVLDGVIGLVIARGAGDEGNIVHSDPAAGIVGLEGRNACVDAVGLGGDICRRAAGAGAPVIQGMGNVNDLLSLLRQAKEQLVILAAVVLHPLAAAGPLHQGAAEHGQVADVVIGAEVVQHEVGLEVVEHHMLRLPLKGRLVGVDKIGLLLGNGPGRVPQGAGMQQVIVVQQGDILTGGHLKALVGVAGNQLILFQLLISDACIGLRTGLHMLAYGLVLTGIHAAELPVLVGLVHHGIQHLVQEVQRGVVQGHHDADLGSGRLIVCLPDQQLHRGKAVGPQEVPREEGGILPLGAGVLPHSRDAVPAQLTQQNEKWEGVPDLAALADNIPHGPGQLPEGGAGHLVQGLFQVPGMAAAQGKVAAEPLNEGGFLVAGALGTHHPVTQEIQLLLIARDHLGGGRLDRAVQSRLLGTAPAAPAEIPVVAPAGQFLGPALSHVAAGKHQQHLSGQLCGHLHPGGVLHHQQVCLPGSHCKGVGIHARPVQGLFQCRGLGVQHRSCCRGQLLRNALCQQAAALHVLLCFLCFLQLHSDFSTSLGHSAAQTHFYKL